MATTAYDKMQELGLEDTVRKGLMELGYTQTTEEIIRGLKNTKYLVKRFRRRLGDATQLVEGDVAKWKDRQAKQGYQYALRMDWRLEKVDRSEFKDTFLHEIAHVIDYMIRGRSNHDGYWKEIASKLEAKPEACKDLGSSGVNLYIARKETSVRNLGC